MKTAEGQLQTEPRLAREASTLAEAFRITAAERDGRRSRSAPSGDAFTITWGELRERVDALAGGLAKLGVESRSRRSRRRRPNPPQSSISATSRR